MAEPIDIHIRTYRSLLKSAGSIKIHTLIESHLAMESILHEKGREEAVDVAAFIYVLLRLPVCISRVQTVILGQSLGVFHHNGLGEIRNWKEVDAAGRRRKMFFDNSSRLAVYIASVSDVDDIITLLTAFQIEWNKFHDALKRSSHPEKKLSTLLSFEEEEKLKNIWGQDYQTFLSAVLAHRVDFSVQLLSGSYVEYAKATQRWWDHIMESLSHLQLDNRPVYFISSNTHSIVNILAPFSSDEEERLIAYIHRGHTPILVRLWEEIQHGDFLANKENFLFYVAKKFGRSHPAFLKKRAADQKRLGISTVKASHFLDIDAQVIEISKLASSDRLRNLHSDIARLKKSPAVIINIDYPLGWAAYQALTEIGQNVSTIRGVYIMGKAATLNGKIGDILIPTTIFDQHTKNVYIIQNAFSSKDFSSFATGSLLDNQKTATVKGTFLQNRKLIESWYREGYTIIEMEAGPYMNAVYELLFYNRYEEGQAVNLVNSSVEIGIAHYSSDTPYSKATNLGVRNLSYEGVEPTYEISRAILGKIVSRELGHTPK